MKRWQRVLIGLGLLSGGAQFSKNNNPNSEFGAALILLIDLCIVICSFWLFFGKIKKTEASSATQSSSALYRCVDCNITVQENDLKNDALLCPSCHGRVEQV
jgi:DNA-directed RNA polymerase subunit RPC12/RpoP